MKDNFSILKTRWLPLLRKHKGGVSMIAILILIFGIGLVVFFNSQENVVLKNGMVSVEVNTELSKDVEDYLDGVKHPEEASVNFDKIDMALLGDYEGVINYKDIDHFIKFKVQDTTKPQIVAIKNQYTFRLDASIDEVNNAIAENIVITDNYDKEFDVLKVVETIPSKASELHVSISVKDKNENESDSVSIIIQFTENGEEAEGLEVVETKANTTYIPSIDTKQSDENETSDDISSSDGDESNDVTVKDETKIPSSEGSTNDGGAGSSNGDVAEKPNDPNPTPTPKPTPKPEPEPEPEQPSTPEYTVPAGAVDGGLFNSEEEALSWTDTLILDTESKYCGWMGNADRLSNGKWHAYLTQM